MFNQNPLFRPLKPEPSSFTQTCLLRASGRQISQVPTGPWSNPIQPSSQTAAVSQSPAVLLLQLQVLGLVRPFSPSPSPSPSPPPPNFTTPRHESACQSGLPFLRFTTTSTPSCSDHSHSFESVVFFVCVLQFNSYCVCIYWFGVVSIRALHIAESVSTKRASINTIHHLVCFYHELQPKPVAPLQHRHDNLPLAFSTIACRLRPGDREAAGLRQDGERRRKYC